MMEKITDFCTGCRTCEQLCPKHSISMVPDKEGFLIAVVNQGICINCGLCVKRCPQNRNDLQNDTPISTIAARLKDEETLYKSASGGAFAGLAIRVINQGGVVFGVRYDKDLRAIHAKAETIEELQPLLSSKYVQSDTGNTFKEVKAILETGRLVLYSGTGCQIAGLKSFLHKEYSNLILVDIVCHGVTSPLLFQKYLEVLRQKHGAPISDYDFRDKKGGWGLGYKYKYKYKYKYGSCNLDPYYSAFLAGDAYRECCYKCKYANTKRPGDITIADYWGIEKFHPDFYSHKGVSLVLLNNERGNALWNKVESFFFIKESKLEYAVVKNGNLREPTLRTKKRDTIYDDITSLSASECIERKLAIHPSIVTKVKGLLPMPVMLMIKKIIWKIKQ